MENNKTYILSEYFNGHLTTTEEEDLQLQMLDNVELREAFLQEQYLRKSLALSQSVQQKEITDDTIRATILTAMRKVVAAQKATEEQKQKNKKVLEAQLRIAYDQIFKTKTEHRSSYPATYVYGSFNTLTARGLSKGAAESNQLITLGNKNLDPQNPPIFKVGEAVNYSLQNPVEETVYFAIVEITEGTVTFIAPDSSFENCKPNQCTLPKEYEIQITEGTFEVELLLSSNPFDFYSQATLSIAEYENWKTTHQDDVAVVITGMKYVGSSKLF